MSRSRLSSRALLAALVSFGSALAAQEPLFTFVQVSDSQPATAAHNQAFVDVLRTIAEAGQPGKLLPRPVDLVLFAGDITFGNTRSEWVAAKQKLDTWLTANNIPYLAVPGNHDVNPDRISTADTSLYREFIADPGVWDVGSASFTGQNGRSRATNWQGLRFIGVNNSNPGWNMVSTADVSAVATRVNAAAAAGENAFILAHHPHNESRTPLASVLTNSSLVGYLHGHSGSPKITKGLAGVTNSVVWDVNTNAIYLDRDLVYFEVFPTKLEAHLVILDNNPTTLPAATVMPLAHPLTAVNVVPTGIGFPDAPHLGARAQPTARGPERKLWFDAGSWWGVLWSDAAAAYRIQRLDRATQSWIDTGTSVSSTAARSFDALAGTNSVVIASNLATSPGALANGSPGQLSRFTFSSALGRYTLDADYPVAISDARSPTLVLARDTLGILWAAWTRAGGVFVAHTLGTDALWSAPLPLTSGVAGTDTVALAAFGGSVGALWSNSVAGTLGFALHLDGDPEELWSSELASTQANLVGDALDLVAVDGRALAAVRAPGGALNLFERALGGGWSVHALASAADALDDPLLVVDRSFGRLRLFASGPTLAGQSLLGGGALFTKLAPLATLDFPEGRGTPVVQDAAHPSCVAPTSTRQELNATTGLAVLGSVGETERYWHAFDALGTLPLAPAAEFVASPLSGGAPLLVSFTELSTGTPTHWTWDFGDGTSSTAREPQHVYAAPGTYTVALRAANGAGQDTRTRTAYVQVTATASVQTFRPVADARVVQSSPNGNGGTSTLLRVKSSTSSAQQSFLRFDLGALGSGVTSVKLRLFCSDASNSGGSVYRITSTTWGETTITWNNRPALPSAPLASLAAVSSNAWAEIELGAGAVSAGLVSLALAGGSSDSADYSSREGAHPPELVVSSTGSALPPTADFSATPLSGPAPLGVTFSDASNGAPTAWAWDFGDGTSSNLRNPTHVYAAPGLYTVVLVASNANGQDTRTRLDYVSVSGSSPVRTFTPVADARVNQANATSNAGTDIVLRVRQDPTGSYHTYLRFDLSSLTGTVVSAKLRLFATDGSDVAGRVFRTSGTWTETGVSWNNQPGPSGALITSTGTVANNAWAEFDVTSVVVGPGLLDLEMDSTSTNSCFYSSREGANPPELVVTLAGP